MANLLKSVKTKELLGDPGYDGENIYQLLKAKGIKPTIRPPNHAKKIEFAEIKTTREEAVDYQQTKGYQAWRVKNKYGRRERVENTFFFVSLVKVDILNTIREDIEFILLFCHLNCF